MSGRARIRLRPTAHAEGGPARRLLSEGLDAVYDFWSANPLPCTKTSDFCTRQGVRETKIVHGMLVIGWNRTRHGSPWTKNAHGETGTGYGRFNGAIDRCRARICHV
jgi:hypothetical protein